MKNLRHKAREAALRSLYLWEVGRTDPARALETFFTEHAPDAPDALQRDLFQPLLNSFLLRRVILALGFRKSPPLLSAP